jgi:hypothetical protein
MKTWKLTQVGDMWILRKKYFLFFWKPVYCGEDYNKAVDIIIKNAKET